MNGRNLSVGAVGEEVGSLHDRLRRQGYELPTSETSRAFFGPATREVVRRVQLQHGLQGHGVVDAATHEVIGATPRQPGEASEIRRAADPTTITVPRGAVNEPSRPVPTGDVAGDLLVRGLVVYKEGLLIEGMTVRAFNVDLRHEDFLGESISDQEGRYEIRYSASQFSRPEKQYADLLLRVFDLRETSAAEKPIYESPIVYGAQPIEKVKLEIDAGLAHAWSEYEQLMAELLPLLAGRPLTELSEDAENQDITFLAGQANLDPRRIAYMVWAHRLAVTTDLPPEALYGFARQGLPLTLPELLAQGQALQRQTLELALDEHIIPGRLVDALDDILARLKSLIVAQAFEPPRESDRASLGQLLATVVPDPDKQARFLEAYVSHEGTPQQFWQAVAKTPELGDDVAKLQVTLQLGALTGGHLPLVAQLQGMGETGQFRSVRDLARLNAGGWEQIIRQVPEADAVPPDIPGDDEDARIRNYASTMTKLIEDTFPTEVVAHRFQQDAAPERADLRAFFGNVLRSDSGFELAQSHIEKHLADNPSLLAGVEDPAVLLTSLKSSQRVARLAPSPDQVLPVLDKGLDSAFMIARMGEPAFRERVADTLDEESARQMYARAEHVAAAALNLFANHSPAINGLGMHVLPWHRPAVEGVPDWETLFGSLDLCACQHCRSVHSPAAYLAEMLAFLKERNARTAGRTVKDVLFERRPDLGEIELTCDNTTTPVPYIDLVNEVLEDAVAPFGQVELPPEVAADLVSGPASETLKAALKAHDITLDTDATVVEVQPQLSWFVTDHTLLFSLEKNQSGALLVISRCRQTSGPTEELAANPQHLNRDAYTTLSQGVYPLTLPFNLWHAQASAFLGHLGAPREGLMRTFYPQGDSAALIDHAVAAEHLGLTTFEWRLITDTLATPSTTWELWGLRQTGNPVPSFNDPRVLVDAGWLEVLVRVRLLLDRAGLSYEELEWALDTSFVNPGWAVSIVSGDPNDPASCDTTKLILSGLDDSAAAEAFMRRLQQFLRLWRTLGWTMVDLDRAVTALGGTGDINQRLSPAFLLQLSHLQRLRAELDLPIEQLLTLWGPIGTSGTRPRSGRSDNAEEAESLYSRLFENPSVLRPVDAAFALDGNELAIVAADPAAALISTHASVILAALRISDVELAELRRQELHGSDALNLANLTRLYRVVVLSRGLQLPVRRLLMIKALIGIDPFDPTRTEETLRLVKVIDKIDASGFGVQELAYILQHRIDEAESVAPDDATVALVLDDIRTNLQRVEQENTLGDDPSGDLTRKKLGLLTMPAGLIELVIATMRGSVIYEAPLDALPNGLTFPAPLRGRIAFDADAKRLTFTGPMTVPEQTSLLDASSETAYQEAVRALARAPRAFVAERLSALELPTFSTPLASLPAGLRIPAALRGRFYYDTRNGLLSYAGMMLETERSQLLSLSTDPAFRTAVDDLFAGPATYVPEPSNTLLTPADAAWLFDAPTAEDQRTPEQRFERILTKLLPSLVSRLSASLVKQKITEAFRLDARVTDELLTRQVRSPSNPANTAIDELLAPVFRESNLAIPLTRAAFEAQFDTFLLLHKAAMVISRFKITPTFLGWLQAYGPTAGWLDLSGLPLRPDTSTARFQDWERLADLAALRDTLPGREATVSEIFDLAAAPGATLARVLDHIAVRGRWDRQDLETLAGRLQVSGSTGDFSLSMPATYLHESALLRLRDCFIALSRLGVSAVRAIEMTKPDLDGADATGIVQAAKAKHDDDTWSEIAAPVRDGLRERQRSALVAYLLARPDPAHGRVWRTREDLYEYFLIDVEMSACMRTSRLKQAISSVQLFVQRCLLNLEPEVWVNEEQDLRWRDWDWMKNYRVWEANRKIFLYPENWIEPELRDDKTPFFSELENELLQDEVNSETAEDALLHYLEKLDQVARLEIVGMYHEQQAQTDVLHVFGRTSQQPHAYFYRRYVDASRWTAWEKVDLDIEGDHLIPVVWNRRLYLFWPIFVEKAEKPKDQEFVFNATTDGGLRGRPTAQEATHYWEIQLAWSERKGKKWLPKRLSTVKHRSTPPQNVDMVLNRRQHFFYAVPHDPGLDIHFFASYRVEQPYAYFAPIIREGWKGGVFHFTGHGGEVVARDARTRRVNAIRGTAPYGMTFAETDSIGLYLPKSPTTGEDGVALTWSPGWTPFEVLYPHQDASVTGQRPLFFQDDTKTFFVSPAGVVFSKGTLRNPTFVTPATIDATRRVYYVEPLRLDEVSAAALDVGTMAIPRRGPARARMLATNVMRVTGSQGGSPPQPHIGAISREVAGILDPKWNLPSPVISTTRRERRYRFDSFYHPYVIEFIKGLNRDGIPGLLTRDQQLLSSEFFAGRYGPTDLVSRYDSIGRDIYPRDDVDFSYTGAYSQYNWELFFHVPLSIARKLSQNQQFEEAQRWYHYIFDPTDTSAVDVPRKYWRTRPFYETTADDYQDQQIQILLRRLADDLPDPELEKQVEEWRSHPFNPHLVARLRTTAYQRTVVMKYIDNLIAWGDQLFRRDTIESLNEATQLYVLAAEILGRRPVIIPRRQEPMVQTYNSLDPKLADFSDRLVQVENFVATPRTKVAPPAADRPPISWPSLPYFCVTENDKLLGYWDTVADRLFKLRNCMNIEGVVRQLALFEPPIDPGLLVRAAAAGVDLSSVLSDVNAPLPNYRFEVMVRKAGELTAEVKSFGQVLLAALEKRDAEDIALLRSSNEISLLEKVREVRLRQRDEASVNLDSLNDARKVTEARRDYYRDIEDRIDEERQHLANLQTAVTLQTIGQGIEILAGALALIPDADIGIAGAFGSPRVGVTFGGQQMSTAVQVASRGFALMSALYNHMATRASIEGGFKRRSDEWRQQEKLASLELDQIQKQIEAAAIRLQIAEREIENHDHQTENARAVDELLRGKFTNRELYDWMVGQISGLYFQSYQLAYDVAKQAERAYRYELGLDDSNFIQFGYWDSLRRGLLAGERLEQDIRRMGASYLDQHRREYEITKNVSLAVLDPVALLRLKETGECYLDVPESFFDLDYPGHYMRRLKSVAMTMPCVTGPHTGVFCTLTLLRNTIRITPASSSHGYARSREGADPRFRDNVGAIQSITTSHGQSDSGLFELSLRDERYLPFEGAGAISRWRIQLAKQFQPFDYDTIADVILHLRYTAREGGEALRSQVVTGLQQSVNEAALAENRRGLYRWFSLKHEFPNEWYRFLDQSEAETGDHVQAFPVTADRFPYVFRGKRLRVGGVQVVALPKEADLEPFDLYLTPSGVAPNENNDRLGLEQDPALPGAVAQVKSYQGQDKEPGETWRLRLRADDLESPTEVLQDIGLILQYRVED
ncbi:MAG: peptidoglycan-binding protein [Actinobacteria bacterium]|nr:peptidoglycan-binding protein [Actinomycetota bacterium]